MGGSKGYLPILFGALLAGTAIFVGVKIGK